MILCRRIYRIRLWIRKMFSGFGKGPEGRKRMNKADWIVFNQGEELEFAECSNCGYEAQPGITHVGGYPKGETPEKKVTYYPAVCPKCLRDMDELVPAEEA